MTSMEDIKVKIDASELEPVYEYVRALEERIMRLEAQQVEIDYGAPNNTNEECRAHTCSYYTHYLMYGPADLEHEGYHAAEKAASQHIRNCTAWETANRPCQLCIDSERRTRA